MDGKREDPDEEIDSYELNEDEHSSFSQYARNSIVDGYGDTSDEMDPFFKNRKLSTGWVESQEKNQQIAIHPTINEDDENFITELDVNSHSDPISQRKTPAINSRKDKLSIKSKKMIVKSRRSLYDIPTLFDQDDDLNNLPYHISNDVLSLEQLDKITKKDTLSKFMLENINLSLLAKFVIKDSNMASSNEIENDKTWTYDNLIAEISEYFKNL